MKPLLILGLLFISAITKGQIFVLIDPGVRRAGMMYNKKFREHRAGLYLKAQYGILKVPDFYTESYKAGAGVSFKISGGGRVYFGINYNHFFNTVDDCYQINLDNIEPVSIDIGLSSGNEARFKLLFITDPINWESSIGFTYQFNRVLTK